MDRRKFIESTLIASASVTLGPAHLFARQTSKEVKVRALLMHLTHYDPMWNAMKEYEEDFSLEVGLEAVQAMKKVGLNTLIVDIEDGVLYQSHPELKRHYSAPMEELRAFASAAREAGISFVPKLNFSKSGRTEHDKWMYPYWDLRNFVAREKEYRKVALDVIDELIVECQPQQYFHIGMDEDHHRSIDQYVDTIEFFREHLQSKGLRTVIWNDSAYQNRNVIAQVHADKSVAAEARISKDIVHILWDYDIVHQGIIKRLTDQGFDAWMAPGRDHQMIKGWKKVLLDEGGDGLLLSNWVKCSEKNRKTILDLINQFGPDLSE